MPQVWSRHCPMGTCRHLITKTDAWEDWVCKFCGWTCGDDVSAVSEQKSNEEKRYGAPPS